MPVSRLTSLPLNPREHLRKFFHVLSFRDVLSAVPAHAGHPWTHKSKPLGHHPSFSCQGLGSSLAWWLHFYLRPHHGSLSTAKLGLAPGHAPIASHGQWHR